MILRIQQSNNHHGTSTGLHTRQKIVSKTLCSARKRKAQFLFYAYGCSQRMKKYAYEFSGPKFTNPCIPLALGCLNVRMEEEQEFYASRTSSPGEENIRCGEEVCLTLNVPYLLDPFFLQIYPLRKWPASSVAIPLVGGNPNPSGRSRH